MKADVEVYAAKPADAPGLARKAEEMGFAGAWFNETKHDPFLQVALAAAATRRIELGTSIALAFTRSPTTLAYTSWDLQSLSSGRFLLGLGSQVRGHVERRFGMKWESPAPKMKDTIGAIRAVWGSWQEGKRLDYAGRFYRLDLMTPFFSPGPIAHPKIPILVAAVNRGMARVAGEAGDGLHVHPLHTVEYLRKAVEPALAEGLAKAKRKRSEVQVAVSVFAAVGETEAEVRSVREAYRSQIAFYASTRSYRPVLELHRWGDVCDRLHQRSVKGEWGKMAGEVGDDMLREFVVEGTWQDLGGELRRRYAGTADRVRPYLPFDGDAKWKRLADGMG